MFIHFGVTKIIYIRGFGFAEGLDKVEDKVDHLWNALLVGRTNECLHETWIHVQELDEVRSKVVLVHDGQVGQNSFPSTE